MRHVVDADGARRADLAKIHMAAKDLGWDDTTYREILWSVCRVKSSADLDFAGRRRLLAHMARCGWKPRAIRRTAPDDPQVGKVRRLWLELHELGYVRDPSEASLSKWIKRETGVQALRWLSSAQLSRSIEKLKRWRDRDAKKVRALADELALQGRIPTSDIAELAALWFGASRLTQAVLQQLLEHLEKESR